MPDKNQNIRKSRVCVVIPTYNNATTVVDVIHRCKSYSLPIIVVDDGSTDATPYLLKQLDGIMVVTHTSNQGKGRALLSGFRKAREEGFTHVISIDSDGQHYPEDLPKFISAMSQHPEAIIVGSRDLNQKNMKGGSKFANKFSNFWFAVQTGIYLPDTQTGYRLYPLENLHGMRYITSRYESELELMVYAAWHNVEIKPIGINVFYPSAEERVTHFRPGYDFLRISMLNTILCILSIVYGYPCKLFNRIKSFMNAKNS